MTDAATTEVGPNRLRPYAVAFVAAVIACTFAAQRQAAREHLELGRPVVDAGATAPGFLPPAPSAWASPPGAGANEAPPRADAEVVAPLSAELEAAAVETFSDARPGLLECLRAERALRPGVAGKLPVTLRVVPPGLVVNVDLGASPVRSETFDECATLALAELVFPAGVAPRELSITFDLR